MNLTDLKEIMNDCIMKPLDHKNIDKDVAYFKNTPSTAENIAVFIFDAMLERLNNPEMLFEVKLWETDKNCVIYQGAKSATSAPFGRRIQRNTPRNVSSDSEWPDNDVKKWNWTSRKTFQLHVLIFLVTLFSKVIKVSQCNPFVSFKRKQFLLSHSINSIDIILLYFIVS